jgi:sulfite reductase (NADPH) hemoprotein beta-component
VHAHKTPGYAAVTLSLKAPGVAPGDISDVQMIAVAELAERFSFGELRVSHEQNVVLADVSSAICTKSGRSPAAIAWRRPTSAC